MEKYSKERGKLYLVIAKYKDEAERKRILYAMERWSSKLKIKKLEGVPILIEGEVDEFVDDLSSRISPENIMLFSKVKKEIEKKRETIKAELNVKLETAESFFNFLMAKLRATLLTSTKETRRYEVYTKKGKANISLTLKDNDKIKALVVIEGYGEAPEFLKNKIEEEIELFREVSE